MFKSFNLLHSGKLLVSTALLSAALFSCSKKDYQDPVQNNDQPVASQVATSSLPSHLLYEENFEGTNTFSSLTEQFGTSYAFGTSSSPYFQGTKAGRFELRDSDPMTSGGTRTEVLFPTQSSL